MISERLYQALNAQIGHELSASHQYLAVATYFGLQSLTGWEQLFDAQSDEERGHARKIIKFLQEVGREPKYDAISAAQGNYSSAVEALEQCLSWEQLVSKQFQDMAKLAIEEGDFTGFQFLQWFIEEQVEEESKMQMLIDIVRSGVNLFEAQALLPQE